MFVKYIPGYEGVYAATTFGKILSMKSGKVLCDGVGTSGYRCVGLYSGGRRERSLVHRLIAAAFLPNPFNLPVVNHRNGDKLDNRVVNLEWCTQAYNMREAVSLSGPWQRSGGGHGMAKLSDDQVVDIRRRYGEGGVRQADLAEEYGVHQTLVSSIVRRAHRKTNQCQH